MLLLNSTLNEVDLKSIVAEGRVMCVNFSHLQNDLFHLKYLHTLLNYGPTNYVNTGIDKLVAISSVSNIHHPQILSFFPTVVTLSDPSYHWLNEIKKQLDLTEPVELLSRQLRCQQLWVNGEISNTWYQPVTNQVEDFSQTKGIYRRFQNEHGIEGINWIRSLTKQDVKDLFTRETELQTNCDLINNNYSFIDYTHFIKWYKLVPNLQLEKVLEP